MAKKSVGLKTENIVFPNEYKVLGADLSLKRPGFCLISIKDSKIVDIKLLSVDNKRDTKKSHGQLLDEVLKGFLEILPEDETTFIVRENEIMKVKVPSERSLSKVVGLLDWAAYHCNLQWESLYPMTIKKLITGNGRAEKQEVANALEKYVGKQDYKCDDESDATAVAIAWLIQQRVVKEKR